MVGAQGEDNNRAEWRREHRMEKKEKSRKDLGARRTVTV